MMTNTNMKAPDAKSPFAFTGNIRKVKIHSNNICFGTHPLKDREVEQHFTITRDGRVWLTRYAFSEDLDFIKFKKTQQKQFRIDKDKAQFLLDKFTAYFRDNYELMFATDVGYFDMWIEDDNGEKAFISGPLICEYMIDGYDLSQLVRDTLDDQTLFVFDGNTREEFE